MANALNDFFSSDYMPHGHCYFWKPEILWLNVLSDLTIAFAYFSIPIALFYFVRKRPDLEFKGIFILFSLFIACCGITHLISIFVVWHGLYGIHGVSKFITAVISATTAFYVFKSMPLALKVPSPSQLTDALQAANDEKLQRITIENQVQRDRILRQSVESSNIGVIVCDDKGIINIANSSLCKMFGYELSEVENQSINVLVNLAKTPNHQDHIQSFMTGNTNTKIMASGRIIMGLHKSGRKIPVEITLNKGEENGASIVYASVIDLTEKLAIQNELLASNDRFERITTATEEGLWEYNLTTQLVWISPRSFELLGYKAGEQEETIQNWLSFVDNEYSAIVESYVHDPLYPDKERYIEFQIRRKNGEYRWFAMQGGNTLDKEGNNLFRSGTVSDIENAKRLENQLAEQEEKYKNIVEQLPLGINIFSMNDDGEMIFVDSNPAADEILGIKNKNLYGLSFEEAFPAIKGTESLGLLTSAALEGTMSKRETVYYEDENISGVFSTIFLHLTSGNAITLFEDVSVQRTAEKSLKESEQFINRALNTSFTGIYIYNFKSGTNEYINLAYTRVLGYTLEDLNTINEDDFIKLIHPNDVDTIFSHMERIANCKDANAVFEIEYRFKHKSGHWVWCLSKDSIFEFDAKGIVTSFIGSFLDITARKATEEKLEQVLRKLNLVMEGSNDGFWHWLDPEKDTAEWSDSFFHMLGYKPQEIVPSFNQLKKMLHPGDLKRTVTLINEAIAAKDSFDVEYRVADKYKNYQWYRGRGTPYYDEKGTFIEMAGSFSNINKMKALQNELVRSNQELEQFSFIASHDLKEPVRTIRTFVEYLMQDIKNGNAKRMAEDAMYITSACERMSNLIDALLELSHAGANELNVELCDLNTVISEVMSNLCTQIKESEATIEVLVTLPSVLGDPLQLSLIFQNLIQNGIKFSKFNDNPKIEIGFNTLAETEEIEIFIRDRGIGIPKDKLKEIFGVFKRLHPADEYSGTGIGLAIVEKAMKRLMGNIRVESTEGEGTTFIITLPNKNGI